MNKSSVFTPVVLLIVVLLAACSNTVSIDYTPHTTAEANGSVTVSPFKYSGAHNAAENEIGSRSLHGGVHLTETVSDYVTNAVKRELRQAGMSLKKSQCTLDGEINDLSYNDFGYSVTFNSDIRYILNNASGKTLFDNDYKVEFEAAKFVTETIFISNLNRSLSNNIDKLLNDSDFVASVERHCK